MTQTSTTSPAPKVTRTRVSSVTGKRYRAHGDGTADRRGNPTDRRNRKIFLLSARAGFGGDGASVPCFYCGTPLTFETVQADRVIADGSYRRDNIRPADQVCNNLRRAAGNPLDWSRTDVKAA